MTNEQKKSNSNYIIIVIILIFAVALFSRFCISDNGTGIDTIRNQLGEAGTNQQSITSGIENAERTTDNITNSVDEIQTGIGNAEQSAIRIENNEQAAGILISDCQRILEGIRKRGKTNE